MLRYKRFTLFGLFLLTLMLLPLAALAQNGAPTDVDSAETLLEQAIARAAEQEPAAAGPLTLLSPQNVDYPLFIGVDDVTAIPAYQVDVITNNFLPAFSGAQVWGAAYDEANNLVYFNSGATLYEWPVGGTINQLGTIVDPGGATQAMVGLAFYNGQLYGTKNIANEAIWTIDPSTLVAAVFIDYVDAELDCGGFAADPNTGTFYCANDTATPHGTGLFIINPDATVTQVAPYPAGQTDIDGLAISNDGFAYLVIDEPGFIYVYDLVGGAYTTPLNNPWTTSEVFSAGAWIWESTQLICNTDPVSIPSSGPATPYPSTITVGGLEPAITDVNVHLVGLSHTWPDDIDILVVGPEGENLIIMSDAGGSADLVGVDLTFDDDAPGPLPDSTQIVAGIYQPTDYEPGDTFDPPAPTPSAATTLATFNGTNPNGDWNLFIMDDTGSDSGELTGGWCLEIVAEPTDARLAVAHLAPFAMDPGTAVTVTLNATPVLTDFVYGDSTPYLTVTAGSYDVAVYPGSSPTPAITGSFTLTAGSDYSVIAIGDGVNQPLELLALLDDNSAPASGNFKLRLGHLAPFAAGNATADVRLQDGTAVLTNVNFSDVASYLELPAGTYDLKITTPGGTTTLIDPMPVTFGNGDIVSAFATGDGSNQDLGVFAWPSDALGFFLPLAPVIHVSPAEFIVSQVVTTVMTHTLTISNIGAGNLDWTIDEDDIPDIRYSQVVVPSASAGSVSIGDGVFNFTAQSAATGATAQHTLNAPVGQTTITHSASQNIVSGNSVSCNAGGLHTDNSYIRRFNLADFGITDQFDVTEVSFGVELASGATGSQPITVNLYTWDPGDPFTFANFTLVGTSSVDVPDQTLSIFTVPVAGSLPPGSTLVVEVFTPSGQAAGNSFFVGSNADGQTAPSYLAAAACGVVEPTDTAAIGFPNMHIVMNVTGDVVPSAGVCVNPEDISWLSVNPNSGTTASGGSDVVDVTFDSTGLSTGVYTGTLCINSNDLVNPLVTVPVTLTVEAQSFGVEVAAEDAALSGDAGTTVMYMVWITNTGNVEDTFNVTVSGNTWTTTPAVTSITLAAGASGSVMVHVDIPASAADGDTDTATVTATSQSDAAATDSVDLTTTAVVADTMNYIYLPIILKP
ncbi:MAG TPA: DUF4397 domain-containing protein [Chloroflexota bacterium]|nr:DUF4397 domain-containing protein [Chloroflexota bacterium]